MSLIAFDYGKHFIGVAVSDENNKFVKTLDPIKVGYYNKNNKLNSGITNKQIKIQKSKVFNVILNLISTYYCKKIIVGLPLSFDIKTNSIKESSKAKKIKKFFKSLQNFLTQNGIIIDIEFIDESYSTQKAFNELKKLGLNKKNIKQKLDSESAKIILEDYINIYQKSKN